MPLMKQMVYFSAFKRLYCLPKRI